jgi:hypothetical protein
MFNRLVSVYQTPIFQLKYIRFLGLPVWRDPFDRKKAG